MSFNNSFFLLCNQVILFNITNNMAESYDENVYFVLINNTIAWIFNF